MLTMVEPDISQTLVNVSQKSLKPRYALFVKEYILTKNAALSARNAGYVSKHSHITGYKLLQLPDIKAAIQANQVQELAKIDEKIEEVNEAREITREKYVDTAWNEYKTTDADKDKANRLRALDLAGKALGYIGSNGTTTTNNTLIVNVDATTLPPSERWSRLRALIEGS